MDGLRDAAPGVAICVTAMVVLPWAPAWWWSKRARTSLRRVSRDLLGLGNRPGLGASARRVSQAASIYGVLGFAIPLAFSALLATMRIVPPVGFAQQQLGTLWQVEGALVGLAIALALFGYESLGKGGAIQPFELEQLRFPRAIFMGLALVSLTGVTYFALPPAGVPKTSEHLPALWLAVGSVGVSIAWILLLLAALPDVIRVTDPGFRIEIRMAQVRPLTLAAVEDRLTDLASRQVLRRYVNERAGSIEAWISGEGTEPDQRYLAPQTGYVRDLNLSRLGRALADTERASIAIGLGQRVQQGQTIATLPRPIPARTRHLLGHMLALQPKASGSRLEQIIASLRDSSLMSIGSRPDAVNDVLDAFAACLDVFADSWNLIAGRMDVEQLREPFRPDTTPLGLITSAVDSLMERAIRMEARDAIAQLGNFPTRVARIGIRHGSIAYVSILDLNLRFYWLAVRDPSSRESAFARTQWTYLIDLIRFPTLGTGAADPTLLTEVSTQAQDQARRVLVSIGRVMFQQRDLAQLDALMAQLASLRDD
jgi:hypothetical protein